MALNIKISSDFLWKWFLCAAILASAQRPGHKVCQQFARLCAFYALLGTWHGSVCVGGGGSIHFRNVLSSEPYAWNADCDQEANWETGLCAKIRMDEHCWTKGSVSKGARRMKGAKTIWTQRVKLSYWPETVLDVKKKKKVLLRHRSMMSPAVLSFAFWTVINLSYLLIISNRDDVKMRSGKRGKLKENPVFPPLWVRCMLSGRGENGKRSDFVLPRCSVSRTGRASCSTSSSQAGVRSASEGLEPGLCVFDSVTSGVRGGGMRAGWTG